MPALGSTTVTSLMLISDGKLATKYTGAEVALAPPSPTATAVMVCGPGGTFTHTNSKGSAKLTPIALVSSKNSTRVTSPSRSVAVADSVRLVGRVKHGATAARATVGALLVSSLIIV